MNESIKAERDDSALVEGLSYEPFVESTAAWLVDETLELGYRPKVDDLYHYGERVYGMTDDQMRRALGIAEGRILARIGPALMASDYQSQRSHPAQKTLPGLERDDDAVWVRNEAFERDEVVADYFSGSLDISEEALITYLQRKYHWTREEAEKVLDGDTQQFSEEVGYGDEA